MMTGKDDKEASSTLINRNVVIDTHRTSVRLEAEMWSDLRDICRREGKSVHEICTLVNTRKDLSRSLTSAIRVFLIAYYRSAATEDGHYRAGHGQGYQFTQRNSVGTDLIGRAYIPEAAAQQHPAQNKYAFRAS
jgi:predicted DNA-binding ribbon-helix-helix protein